VNEDAFNMSLRKFLKTVGVTGQREIEQAVRAALAEGRVAGNAALAVEARITIGGIGLEHTIAGTITLE